MALRLVAIVLKPGVDLRTAIEEKVREHKISAGTVISCVGALSHARLRMAGTGREGQDVRDLEGDFEILSVNGNVGQNRTHLHLSISDKDGHVYGGHIKTGGNIVDITCELVIMVDDSQVFSEEHDPDVGWDNLVIK
jgi:predicted DNA-binding protein with PD1-like motif